MNIDGVLDQVKADLLLDNLPGVWAYDDGGGPANCTIAEMLRDLFGFPVVGPIDALAFSVDEIGAQRYNTAQASLRRACTRLQTRGLIDIWFGQRQTLSIFHADAYTRSRISLIESGVAVADALIRNADQAARGLPVSSDKWDCTHGRQANEAQSLPRPKMPRTNQ
jgi:hypothetical protein